MIFRRLLSVDARQFVACRFACMLRGLGHQLDGPKPDLPVHWCRSGDTQVDQRNEQCLQRQLSPLSCGAWTLHPHGVPTCLPSRGCGVFRIQGFTQLASQQNKREGKRALPGAVGAGRGQACHKQQSGTVLQRSRWRYRHRFCRGRPAEYVARWLVAACRQRASAWHRSSRPACGEALRGRGRSSQR